MSYIQLHDTKMLVDLLQVEDMIHKMQEGG